MPLLPKLSATLSSNSVLSPSNSHHKPALSHHSSNASVQTNNNIDKHVQHPLNLAIDLESPPNILYGPPNESSGCLISGQLHIEIPKDAFQSPSSNQLTHPPSIASPRPSNKRTHSQNALHNTLANTLQNLSLSPSHSRDISPVHSNNNSYTNLAGLMNIKDHVLVNMVQLSLVQKITYAKPFLPPSNTLANCSNCKKKTVELARWDILSHANNLPIGKHSYPFSHLLPGELPATTSLGSSSLTSIKYELVAICSYNNHSNHQQVTKVILPLNISRSILRGPDRNSLRVFPPTDVTATAVLPNVIYPKSSFALELKLDGVSVNDRRWRMRRVGWRIEENIKVKANSCQNHKTKLKVVEEHIRKNQLQHKPPPIKRNQTSGPTTSISVSNTPQLSPDITPSQSATNLQQQAQQQAAQQATQNTSSDTTEAIARSNSNDDLASIHTTNPNLHPSDHANEELRQQQQTNQQQQQQKKEEFALYSEETRTVSSGDLRNGWKSDFSGKGKIELIADISCFNLTSASGPHHTHASTREPIDTTHPHHHANVSCDIDDPVLGINVTHVLIVEVVVAEELLQPSSSSSSIGNNLNTSISNSNDKSNKPDQRLAELSPMFANHNKVHPSTSNSPLSPSNSRNSNNASGSTNGSTNSSSQIGVPTGAARVLRMQFKIIITERSGLGIAWDDEVPPTYDDVSTLSPPTYDRATIDDNLLTSPSLGGIGIGVDQSQQPPLYPLNLAPAHTHTHINGVQTPGVINGIGNTPVVTPRPSAQYNSINGALELDEFTLN
ncbi:hypothetical protein BN7_5480 [Wickerhamomyces ciferrii]|uniref:LDB19 N-terminal domain-containing protein n=1 Tax=Wickerhamomyces ciferrii (strain ATCC 14091 / BCRC 22168 / CBS 111 / JCM 3599 / NBRC 0793 / NRRL Y-1031 F-60-10) TaxID=1206466 RepID=K0KXU2_WICCF|nr:uncharacterized protein BN7_5480 [Wickerhamomyces ciferrii]CCH45893.1 hypothetical protein BN7_5480 [Wickerhamomyces ciferrii]